MGTGNPIYIKKEINEIRAKNFIKIYKNLKDVKCKVDNLNKESILKAYLIGTKSIPKFVDLIDKYNNILDILNDNNEIEDNLKEVLSKYEVGDNIILYNSYKKCKEILDNNDQKENEFIIVNEEILSDLKCNNFNNKYVEIKYYNENKQIKFPSSLKIISFISKNESFYYKFENEEKKSPIIPQNETINTVEILFNNKTQTIKFNEINNNNDKNSNYNNNNSLSNYSSFNPIFTPSVLLMLKEYEKKKNPNNYIKDTIDLFPLLYCIRNISPLAKYFLDNKKIFLSNNNPKYIFSKAISGMIYELYGEKNNPSNFDIFQKKIGNNKEKLEAKNLISFLYEELHKELNIKNPDEKIITDASDKTNLEEELFNCRINFDKRNESIITELFYFEEINTNQCIKCKSITYDCTVNNKIVFILDDVLSFLLKNGREYIENVKIKDCFDYLINKKQSNIKCLKCKSNNEFNCSSSYKLNSLPEILTIVLERKTNFENGVEFGLDFKIDLDNYKYKWAGIKENTEYELIGMLTHFRKENNSAHTAIYQSIIDQKWYFYKNSSTIIDNISEPYKGMPYLLFYKRIQ